LLAAVVVLYKPDERACSNIQTYLESVDRLYIADNSPSSPVWLATLLEREKVTLLSSSVNRGLAEAYNLALERAEREGYLWLMTMDQDSSFEPRHLKKFFMDFDKTDKKGLALYAPLHTPKFLSQKKEEAVTIAMSSGTIVHVGIALRRGRFDTALFIDEVDHEFCLRVGVEGYRILQNSQVCLTHKLGEDRGGGRRSYPAGRLYYMARNYLYVRKKYYESYPDFFLERDRYMRRFLFGQVWQHGERFSRMAMILRGVKDYLFERMGKRVVL